MPYLNLCVYNCTLQKHCQFVLDVTEPIVAVNTGIIVDRQTNSASQEMQTDAQMEELVDSLEMPTSMLKGAERYASPLCNSV